MNNNQRENCEGRASGRVGFQPATFRILRNASAHRVGFSRTQTSAGCRAECAARRVENPPYPRRAVLLILALVIHAPILASAEDAEALFVRRIAPLFAEKCL